MAGRHFVRLAGAAQRVARCRMLATFSAAKLAGMSGVQIGPGATPLTRMLLLGKRLRQRAGEGDDRALGRGIVDQMLGLPR